MLSMSQVIEQQELLTSSEYDINDTVIQLSGLNLPVADLTLSCEWEGMRKPKGNVIEKKMGNEQHTESKKSLMRR